MPLNSFLKFLKRRQISGFLPLLREKSKGRNGKINHLVRPTMVKICQVCEERSKFMALEKTEINDLAGYLASRGGVDTTAKAAMSGMPMPGQSASLLAQRVEQDGGTLPTIKQDIGSLVKGPQQTAEFKLG